MLPIGSVRGGVLGSGNVGPDIPDSVIDNFESVGANPPGVYETGQTIADYYSGNVGDFSRTQTDVIGGSSALDSDTASSKLNIISYPGDGLNRYPSEGDTVAALLRDQNNAPGLVVNASGSGGTLDGYVCDIFSASNEIRIFEVSNNSPTLSSSASVTLSTNTWYWVEVDLGDAENNTLTFTVYEANTTTNPPSRGAQLGQISNTDATYISNRGIGIRQQGSSGSGVSLDWIRVL